VRRAPLDRGQRNVALLVAGCFFMENLDVTIVTTAAPKIGHSLHVPSVSTGLIITAYLLTLAVLIPLSGWLTARYGARPVFLCAIAIFTLASIGCAASTSLGELVGMRVLQGAGGAMMVPVGRFTVIARAAKSDLIRIISYVSWPGLVAPVIAPLAGGLITTYASWRWLFLINAPLGAIAFIVAWRLIGSLEADGEPPPLDRVGVVLTGAGLAGLTWAAHLVSEPRTPWAQFALLTGASTVALAASIRHLRRTPAPLINLRTLRIPTFRAASLGSGVFWVAIGAAPFLLPLLFQTVFNWDAVKSGAVVLFLFVGNIAIKPATTPLLNRFGFRRVLIVATAGLVLTMLVFAFLTAGTPVVVIAAVALASGAFRSTSLTCYITIAFADVGSELMRDANTFYATNQQLASGTGVAIAAVALRIGGVLSGHASGTTPFTVAFLALAVIALVPAVGAVRLHPSAGDALRRRRGPGEPAAAS
jgi:EmrB/QacA subfamily drug resistance transporter